MSKLTEAHIDLLIKRVNTINDDQVVLHRLIGWFKNQALDTGTGHRPQVRRAEGRAFFAAIECLIEDIEVPTKP